MKIGLNWLLIGVFCLVLGAGSFAFSQTPTAVDKPKSEPNQETITVQTDEQVQQTLKSFQKLDAHPLFEMKFHGDYVADTPLAANLIPANKNQGWACSIFVSYGNDGAAIYGRNFDWQHNPALVLHTNPSNAYASISMVDISYLGFSRKDEKYKTVEGRKELLTAPLLPFDGMNEHGLTVGMAAVGDTQVPNQPDRPNVGSLQIIRLMLDRAKNVDEALLVFEQFNVTKRGGPNIHYLVADANGNSALIELKDNKTNISRNKVNWQSATNFYLTGEKNPLAQCPRFAKIHRTMSDNKGDLSIDQTFNLLKNVAQRTTRWSMVYDMKSKTAQVAMSRNFNKRTKFAITKEQTGTVAKKPGN